MRLQRGREVRPPRYCGCCGADLVDPHPVSGPGGHVVGCPRSGAAVADTLTTIPARASSPPSAPAEAAPDRAGASGPVPPPSTAERAAAVLARYGMADRMRR